MKKIIFSLFVVLGICFSLTACNASEQMTYTYTATTLATTPTQTDATDPTEPPPPPLPEHSDLYIDGLSVEDVITYFNEVALDVEFSTGSGDPSLIQKWEIPLVYRLYGDYTEKDLQILTDFCSYLNNIDGFPGIRQATTEEFPNLKIYFYNYSNFVNVLGNNFADADGAVNYWYHTDTNDIYDSTIYIRTDIDQEVRNSVIQEEIYNGLGLTQDTDLREDSIIFSGYSFPQELTEIDDLLLRLICHPDIKPGMNAEACETVIRALYY